MISRFIFLALGAMLTLGSSLARAEGKLNLYIFPSPLGINWSSPSALAWSALKNELVSSPHASKHSIGHVDIELTCRVDGQTEPRRIVTGMTDKGINLQRDSILKDKIGLGVLFKDYPGTLETREEIEEQLPLRFKQGDIATLQFVISDSTCTRLMQFHDEFRDNGSAEHYGLPNRPRFHEGAGCSAYSNAYLELAGLLTEEMRSEWSKTIRIPIDMIGGGEAATPPRKVSMLRILFTPWRKWARDDQPQRQVFMWDPDAMYRWVRAVFDSKREDFDRISIDGSVGLRLDARAVPTPSDPIWQN